MLRASLQTKTLKNMSNATNNGVKKIHTVISLYAKDPLFSSTYGNREQHEQHFSKVTATHARKPGFFPCLWKNDALLVGKVEEDGNNDEM